MLGKLQLGAGENVFEVADLPSARINSEKGDENVI
jgi:hypothetical protein